MEKKPIVIFYRESWIGSIVADVMTFSLLVVLGAFDHFVLNDSKVVAVLFFFVFLMYAIGKANSKKSEYYDLASLKEYVNSL